MINQPNASSIINSTAKQTYSGQFIDFSCPEKYNYSIEEIAIVLSRQPRFTAHTKRFLSVARHSLEVMSYAPDDLKLYALLHDAHEAYIGDISSPLINFLGADKINELKKSIQRAIYISLDVMLPTEEQERFIKNLDSDCLYVEKRDNLMHNINWNFTRSIDHYRNILSDNLNTEDYHDFKADAEEFIKQYNICKKLKEMK